MINILSLCIVHSSTLAHAFTRFGGINWLKFWQVIQVLKKVMEKANLAFFCVFTHLIHEFHRQFVNMLSIVPFKIPK